MLQKAPGKFWARWKSCSDRAGPRWGETERLSAVWVWGEPREGLAAARHRGSSFSGGTGTTGAAAALARGRVQPQSSPALLQHRCRGRSDVPQSLCVSPLQGRIILCFPGRFPPGVGGFWLGWAVIGNKEILRWRRLPPWLCVVRRQRCGWRGLPCPNSLSLAPRRSQVWPF